MKSSVTSGETVQKRLGFMNVWNVNHTSMTVYKLDKRGNLDEPIAGRKGRSVPRHVREAAEPMGDAGSDLALNQQIRPETLGSGRGSPLNKDLPGSVVSDDKDLCGSLEWENLTSEDGSESVSYNLGAFEPFSVG
jgi:hypothetical protein